MPLRDEVAALFSEFERPAVDFGELHVDNATAAELTYEAAWISETHLAPAERWACPHCGALVELKQGMRYPVHMGNRQEIQPPCKAVWRSREQP
jgi:hypothetical protein